MSAILAASYFGPVGHGNDRKPMQPWPDLLAKSLQEGDLGALHWSSLFPSDPGRFARMDLMSRLGLMAVELLEVDLASLLVDQRDRIAVCVETWTGSLATDLCFLQTPRASLFSYTLPSTVIGEICIRYHLRGPVLCLLKPDSDSSAILAEAVDLLEHDDADACLCVSCEAVDGRLTSALTGLPLPGWEAGALLAGKAEGRSREYPLSSEPLLSLCRRLCPQSLPT